MSNGFSYQPNSEVAFQGKPHRIIKTVDMMSVLLEDMDTGTATVVRVSELSPVKAANDKTARLATLDGVPDEEWKEARQRLDAIRPLLGCGKNKTVAVKQRAKECGTSLTTLYRWMKFYEDSGLLSSLLPARRSKKRSKPRLDKRVEAVVRSVIREYYLTKQKPTAKKTAEEILRRCRNARLKPPHPNTIRRRIKAIDEKEKVKRRQGAKAARDRFSEVKGAFPNAETPLAVVQIDHTKLDIELVDDEERQPLGRPWLTLAIDVYSRMIAGFHISLDPPSAMSVGLCLINAILPKDEFLMRLGIKGDWPVWGFMDTVHTDNGKEFRSKTMEKAYDEYNITPEWRPVKVPHFGGNVERVLGTLAKEIHALPGTTFSNIRQKGAYKSDKQSAMTLDEMEKWLTKFIVGVYHKRLHKGIGMSPEEKWSEGIFGKGGKVGKGLPDPIKDSRRLRLDLLPFTERTVQRDGITWDGMTYFADCLRPWINAKKGGVKQKFIVRRDPRDITLIHFHDPELDEYFDVPCRELGRPPITLWEYKAARKRLRDFGEKTVDEEAIFDAHDELHELKENAKKETRKARRNRQRKKQALEGTNGGASQVPGNGAKLRVVPDWEDVDDDEEFDFDEDEFIYKCEDWS